MQPKLLILGILIPPLIGNPFKWGPINPYGLGLKPPSRSTSQKKPLLDEHIQQAIEGVMLTQKKKNMRFIAVHQFPDPDPWESYIYLHENHKNQPFMDR